MHSGKHKSFSMATKEKKTWKEQETRLKRQVGVGTQRMLGLQPMDKGRQQELLNREKDTVRSMFQNDYSITEQRRMEWRKRLKVGPRVRRRLESSQQEMMRA